METWLIEKGKKVGPLQAYQIREKITRGELGPEIKGWYQGCEDWKPLGEIALFKDSFERISEKQEEPTTPIKDQAVVSVEGAPVIRRLLARMLDSTLHSSLLLIVLVYSKQPFLEFLMSPLSWAVTLSFFFFYDTICLALWGATLGKKVMGLSVTQENGNPLSFRQSFLRQLILVLSVTCFGVAFLIPPLFLMSMGFMCFDTIKNGKSFWDRKLNLKADHLPHRIERSLLFIIIYFGFHFMVQFVTPKERLENLQNEYQQLVEEFMENPQKASKRLQEKD